MKKFGFRNLGNTCYMNSALQVLLNSNLLNNQLIEYVENKELGGVKNTFIEYVKLISESNTSSLITPTNFKNSLNDSMFSGSRQEDSHEFILYLLNNIIDSDKKILRPLLENTLIGKYTQDIKCTKCSAQWCGTYEYMSIPLPINNTRNKRVLDLEDCFNEYSKWEELDSKNLLYCKECNTKVIVKKKMSLETIPNLLIIMFNRFKDNKKNNQQIKIYQLINLDSKNLKLTGLVCHIGGTNGGHYYACVLKDRWYCMDDSNITPIEIENFLCSDSVYLAIYQSY